MEDTTNSRFTFNFKFALGKTKVCAEDSQYSTCAMSHNRQYPVRSVWAPRYVKTAKKAVFTSYVRWLTE